MSALVKEEFTIAISSDIVAAIQSSSLSTRLRGCAASSGFVDKTDKEIKEMMYKEKYGI